MINRIIAYYLKKKMARVIFPDSRPGDRTATHDQIWAYIHAEGLRLSYELVIEHLENPCDKCLKTPI